MTTDRKYIGDGVYVSFNHGGVDIAVNHHENQVVFLEPEVALSLVEYIKKHISQGEKK